MKIIHNVDFSADRLGGQNLLLKSFDGVYDRTEKCHRLSAGKTMTLRAVLHRAETVVLALWLNTVPSPRGQIGNLEIIVNGSVMRLPLKGTGFAMECYQLPQSSVIVGRENIVKLHVPEDSTADVGVRCAVLCEHDLDFRLCCTLDFSRENWTPFYSLRSFMLQYNEDKMAWSLPAEQFVNASFEVTEVVKDMRYGLTLVLGKDTSGNPAAVKIVVNGTVLEKAFIIPMEDFGKYTWQIRPDILKEGKNIIQVCGSDLHIPSTLPGMPYLRGCGIEADDWTENFCDWMKGLDDELTLDQINLPGSHDAAAINRFIPTPYACHSSTITEQLESGIRLLDVRIKIKYGEGRFTFVTCHGNLGGGKHTLNEFQSLKSLLDECSDFLKKSPQETLVLTIKVDDWNGMDSPPTTQNEAKKALKELLNKYPAVTDHKALLKLGAVRGRMVLYSRIEDEDHRFGCPIKWDENTQGSYAEHDPARDYNVYVQDYFRAPEYLYGYEKKLSLILETFGKKKPGEVVMNYASGTVFLIMGVYLHYYLIQAFGYKNYRNRPVQFGWLFMDYETESYCTIEGRWLRLTEIIIASNYGYRGLEDPFELEDYFY